jgi:hypothetical protein
MLLKEIWLKHEIGANLPSLTTLGSRQPFARILICVFVVVFAVIFVFISAFSYSPNAFAGVAAIAAAACTNNDAKHDWKDDKGDLKRVECGATVDLVRCWY